MTPAQLHDAHAQGMSEREIDDQEAEDEAFERMERQALMAPKPTSDYSLEEAYKAGWVEAACWAKRNDLIADIDSQAYINDREAHLDSLRNQTPKPMTGFDIRGKLSTLKCWHRLTPDQVQDLISFFRKQHV